MHTKHHRLGEFLLYFFLVVYLVRSFCNSFCILFVAIIYDEKHLEDFVIEVLLIAVVDKDKSIMEGSDAPRVRSPPASWHNETHL